LELFSLEEEEAAQLPGGLFVLALLVLRADLNCEPPLLAY